MYRSKCHTKIKPITILFPRFRVKNVGKSYTVVGTGKIEKCNNLLVIINSRLLFNSIGIKLYLMKKL